MAAGPITGMAIPYQTIFVIESDGTVFGWGLSSTSGIPVTGVTMAGLSPAKTLAAGSNLIAAIKTDGSLVYQSGDRTSGTVSLAPGPFQAVALTSQTPTTSRFVALRGSP